MVSLLFESRGSLVLGALPKGPCLASSAHQQWEEEGSKGEVAAHGDDGAVLSSE